MVGKCICPERYDIMTKAYLNTKEYKYRNAGEKMRKKRGQVLPRIFVYLFGLLVMALGIVLLIKSDLGATPWDVLHVGLFYNVGLTIGSWSIIAGLFILAVSAVLAKEFPPIGAFINMLLVGVFIDVYLLIPFIDSPGNLPGRIAMFVFGILFIGYGMGIYISAKFGTGPRDSLMIAIVNKTGWKIRNVRSVIELTALIIGWRLGGPVFWGTIFYSFSIGPIAGIALPQSQRMIDDVLCKLKQRQNKKVINNETNRSAVL